MSELNDVVASMIVRTYHIERKEVGCPTRINAEL